MLCYTIWLSLATLILTVFNCDSPLKLIAGRYQNSWADKMISVGYNYVSYAVPLFVFALLMLFIFGFRLYLFPTSGSVNPQACNLERGIIS